MVTIVKCQCGDSICNTYGLSDGTFYRGNGWPQERAQQYANAINAYDNEQHQLELLRKGLPVISLADRIGIECDLREEVAALTDEGGK